MEVTFPIDSRGFTELFMLALTVWREASSQTLPEKYGVASVIRNRVMDPKQAYGTDWEDVVTKRSQFTSIDWWKQGPTPGTIITDPNAVRWPTLSDASWRESLTVAEDVYYGHANDPTQGATNYFDRSLDQSPPKWAIDGSHTLTIDIGAFHFYALQA
jgi:spore germination cell wall hydrolase CwlJ-like protein